MSPMTTETPKNHRRFGILGSARAWNIAARTAHIAAMGVLLGGHAFDVPPQRLIMGLWATIGSGLLLGALEAEGGFTWLHQGRGLMTLGKLALLFAVPLLWGQWGWRLAVLLTAVALGSVGSHMPARFRYYSVLHGELIRPGSGPGVSRINEDDNGS